MKTAFIVSAALLFAALRASALNVVYDGRTPQEHREWAERNHLPAHMEVAARRICTALYGNEPRSRLYENFTITLYLAPTRGGNPAFGPDAASRGRWASIRRARSGNVPEYLSTK